LFMMHAAEVATKAFAGDWARFGLLRFTIAHEQGHRAGWFSLNVPAGMCIYWLTNNVLTTAQQVYLKSTTKVDTPAPAATSKRGTIIDAKIEGGSASSSGDTRRSKQGEKFRARQAALQDSGASNGGGGDPRGKKKKKGAKFAQRKAQQGKQQPASAGTQGGAAAGEPTAEKAAETVASAAVDKVKETTKAASDA
jgi:hypothetical protein